MLTKHQQSLLIAAIETAKELGERGKELTGIIGELSACLDDKRMKWEPSKGYDLKSDGLLLQVKTRRSPMSSETMGWFRNKKGEYLFDVALYVELDNEYGISGIWHMSADDVKELEVREKSNRGLRVKAFKDHGERLK